MVPMRYLFLFMGMAATFCGFCLNELFSLPLNTFDSCFKLGADSDTGMPGRGIGRELYPYMT